MADVIDSASEFIKDTLYFATLRVKPTSTNNTTYFCTDAQFTYEGFFQDFGPLNISKLYRYCLKLKRKLKTAEVAGRRLVHYSSFNPRKRINAAFLIASFAILYLKMSAEEAMKRLRSGHNPPFTYFRDASQSPAIHTITLHHCLSAIEKGMACGFIDFDTFNVTEYEYYEKVENGDLCWIVPQKFIAFCSPHNCNKYENGYPQHSPEFYTPYFLKNHVTDVVRLNRKLYDAKRFTDAGLQHHDMFFMDGSTPSDDIINRFLKVCDEAEGVVAVHCKAGLGRTGTLIGCELMRRWGFGALEAIAWMRICRPGSVIGVQQPFLVTKQEYLLKLGAKGNNDKNNRNVNNNKSNIKNNDIKNNSKNTNNIKTLKNSLNSSMLIKIVKDKNMKNNYDDEEDESDDEEDDDGYRSHDTTTILNSISKRLNKLTIRKGTESQGEMLNRRKFFRRPPRQMTLSSSLSASSLAHKNRNATSDSLMPPDPLHARHCSGVSIDHYNKNDEEEEEEEEIVQRSSLYNFQTLARGSSFIKPRTFFTNVTKPKNINNNNNSIINNNENNKNRYSFTSKRDKVRPTYSSCSSLSSNHNKNNNTINNNNKNIDYKNIKSYSFIKSVNNVNTLNNNNNKKNNNNNENSSKTSRKTNSIEIIKSDNVRRLRMFQQPKGFTKCHNNKNTNNFENNNPNNKNTNLKNVQSHLL